MRRTSAPHQRTGPRSPAPSTATASSSHHPAEAATPIDGSAYRDSDQSTEASTMVEELYTQEFIEQIADDAENYRGEFADAPDQVRDYVLGLTAVSSMLLERAAAGQLDQQQQRDRQPAPYGYQRSGVSGSTRSFQQQRSHTGTGRSQVPTYQQHQRSTNNVFVPTESLTRTASHCVFSPSSLTTPSVARGKTREPPKTSMAWVKGRRAQLVDQARSVLRAIESSINVLVTDLENGWLLPPGDINPKDAPNTDLSFDEQLLVLADARAHLKAAEATMLYFMSESLTRPEKRHIGGNTHRMQTALERTNDFQYVPNEESLHNRPAYLDERGNPRKIHAQATFYDPVKRTKTSKAEGEASPSSASAAAARGEITFVDGSTMTDHVAFATQTDNNEPSAVDVSAATSLAGPAASTSPAPAARRELRFDDASSTRAPSGSSTAAPEPSSSSGVHEQQQQQQQQAREADDEVRRQESIEREPAASAAAASNPPLQSAPPSASPPPAAPAEDTRSQQQQDQQDTTQSPTPAAPAPAETTSAPAPAPASQSGHPTNDAPLVSSVTASSDAAVEERPLTPSQLGWSRPIPEDDIHGRLVRFYEKYNAAQIPNVKAMVHKYGSRRDALVDAVVRKYGPEPGPILQNGVTVPGAGCPGGRVVSAPSPSRSSSASSTARAQQHQQQQAQQQQAQQQQQQGDATSGSTSTPTAAATAPAQPPSAKKVVVMQGQRPLPRANAARPGTDPDSGTPTADSVRPKTPPPDAVPAEPAVTTAAAAAPPASSSTAAATATQPSDAPVAASGSAGSAAAAGAVAASSSAGGLSGSGSTGRPLGFQLNNSTDGGGGGGRRARSSTVSPSQRWQSLRVTDSDSDSEG